jgi:hypothetical protein
VDVHFDPALAAQAAFRLAQTRHELGSDQDLAHELEAVFSSGAGEEAREAYRRLLALGERHPHAHAFQEFLIYSTWQQAAETPVAEHFHRGRDLRARFLARTEAAGTEASRIQVRTLRTSFLSALGEREQDEIGEEYDRDAFKWGD